MRRHNFIARLGPSDTSPVQTHMESGLTTELRFVKGRQRLDFGLGQLTDQLAARAVVPSEEAVELGILAACVTAADTRVSRAADSQDSWTREFDIHMPVTDVDRWQSAARLVERTLAFLTGDRWRLFFRTRRGGYRTPRTRRPPAVRHRFSSVCLLSGGLDSFVGAIDLLASGEAPLFVSHYWDISTSAQPVCARRIGAAYGDLAPRHVRARIGFDANDFGHEMAYESTTRGRSFLFFAMAAAAASGLEDTPAIYVPENGLISLNVPLDPLRVGAWSTRTTHPFYMARWKELLDHLGIRAIFENPYSFVTKGEMLAGCSNVPLAARHVADTISCASIAKARWRGLPPTHCGFCVPCLIRRAAINSAFTADPTTYTIPDLSAGRLNSKRPEGEHVRSFQLMARRLAKRPALARILVQKSGPLSDYTAAEITEYANVLSRGIAEVASLVENADVRPA